MTDLPATAGTSLITQRTAARLLTEQCGLGRRHAERVLATGVAGVPIDTSVAKLYNSQRVRALAAWPRLTTSDVDRACPRGFFLSRRPIGDSWSNLDDDWDIAWMATVLLQLLIERQGPFPLIATVSGFVVTCADIVAVDFGAQGKARLHLHEPGRWTASIATHRYATGAGREFVVRVPGWTPAPLTRRRGAGVPL